MHTIRGIRRWLVALGATLALVAFVILGSTSPAAAHTNFVGSDPADGSVLATAPHEVLLRFSESLDVHYVHVELTSAAGKTTALGEFHLDDNSTTIVATLPSLGEDAYRLSYRVRDPIDLHETSGSIAFGVGHAVAALAAATNVGGPDALESVARAVARIGLVVAAGALLFAAMAALCPPNTGGETHRRLLRRWARLARAGLVGVAAGTVFGFVVLSFQVGVSATTFRRLLAGEYGQRAVATLVLAGAAAWFGRGLSRAASREITRARDRATVKPFPLARTTALSPLVFVLGLIAVAAASGHAVENGAAFGVVLRVVHVGAVCAWIGGLIALAVVFPFRTQHPNAGDAAQQEGRIALRAWLLHRFMPVALVSVAALVSSGFLLASRQVATVTALLATPYGRVLGAKWILLIPVVLLGWRHRRRLASAVETSVASVAVELALAAVLVVLGATLAASPPARGPAFDAAPTAAAAPATVTTDAGDVLIRTTVAPNRPGRNLVSVDVLDKRRPALAVTGVEASFAPATGEPVTLQASGPSSPQHYELGALDVTSAGSLGVRIVVQRQGVKATEIKPAWSVNPLPTPRHATVVSAAGVERPFTAIGIVVACIAGISLISLVTGRRRRATVP